MQSNKNKWEKNMEMGPKWLLDMNTHSLIYYTQKNASGWKWRIWEYVMCVKL